MSLSRVANGGIGILNAISPIRFKKDGHLLCDWKLEVLLRMDWKPTTSNTLYCPAARKGQHERVIGAKSSHHGKVLMAARKEIP